MPAPAAWRGGRAERQNATERESADLRTVERLNSTGAAFRPALLAGLGAWAAVVPYLATAVGLEVDVPAKVEVVDHVVPGAIVIAASAALVALRLDPEGLPALSLAGVAALAGFWTTSTHMPLLAEAADGVTPWGAALLHFSSGPPVVLVALWMILAPAGARD